MVFFTKKIILQLWSSYYPSYLTYFQFSYYPYLSGAVVRIKGLMKFIFADGQVKGVDVQSGAESSAMLHGIVRHFQTLFDVPNVLGVYARMSAVYRTLSETHTVLTTLRDHLDLGKSFSESQSYGASPAIRDHTVLPTTRHM